MEIILILIKQCIIMLLLILTGFLLYRKKILTDVGSRELSNILVRLVIPCVIIDSYISADFSRESLTGLLMMFVFSLLALVLAMVISYIVFGKKRKVMNFSAAFSNAGFMGIPLVSATLGSGAVFYVAVFVALLNIFQWTYGLMIMTEDKKYISVRKIITNPVLDGFIVAIAGYLIPIDIPSVIVRPISYIGAMNTPVAMIVLGVYLAQTDIKKSIKNIDVWMCCLIRLIVIPVITIFIFALIPVSEGYDIIKQAALIAAITPVGANVAIFAKLYGADYEQSVRVVCVSTLMSVVTMPAMMYIANMLI
ncbi:MAG: AEC family transporter [Lachnospira sp.]